VAEAWGPSPAGECCPAAGGQRAVLRRAAHALPEGIPMPLLRRDAARLLGPYARMACATEMVRMWVQAFSDLVLTERGTMLAARNTQMSVDPR
jgi:hypothetical protein